MNEELKEKYVNKTGFLQCDGLFVRVIIEDAKELMGRIQVYIRPTDGHGGRWRYLKNITLEG